MWTRALLALDKNPGWLSDDSWVVVQIHPKEFRDHQNMVFQNFEKFDERKYGSTLLVFYEKKE